MGKGAITNDLFTLLPLPALIFNLKTLEIQDVNNAAIEQYGYTRAEFIGFTLHDLRPTHEVAETHCSYAGMEHKKGNTYFGIFTHQKKNGTLIQVEINGHRVDLNNSPCMVVFCQEIHDRKLNEIGLQESLKTLEDYKFSLDQSAIVAFTDATGVITSVNDNFCKISKYAKAELIGNTHRVINSGHHANVFFVDLWKTIGSGKVWRGEIKNRAKDGSFYWVDTTIVPFLNEEKKPFQYLAIRFDITDRKLADEKIVQALEDKINILESIGDAFFAMDKNWIVTYWNKEAENLSGRKREDLIGKNLWNVLADLIDTDFYVQYHKAMERGEKVVVEDYYPAINKWLEATVYPSIDGLSIYFKDVSLRKETDQRLASIFEEKNSLLKTVENSLNEIYTFDSETFQFTYVNKGARLNLGYSEQEIKRLTPIDLKPEFTVTSFKQLIIPLLNNEQEKIVFFTDHKRKNGTLYPVEVHLQLVTEGNNKRFLAIILDITERKKAEECIQQSNERFEKVTEATNDAIWDWNIEEDTFYRSQNIYKFFGKNTSTKLHTKDFWSDAFFKGDLDAIKESLAAVLQDPREKHWETEYRIFNESGKIIYVIDRGVIIRDSNGKAIRMIGAMTDVTKSKTQEQQLLSLNESLQKYTKESERSNEELESFAFITSHDLQEPLRMISSFMDQLKRKYGYQLDDKALQYIQYANDGAKRMKQIILDLLDYSRAGRPSETMEVVDPYDILSAFKQLRRKVISEKGVTITTFALPTMHTYKAAFTQVLHSLLDNAIKYSKVGVAPVIEIAATEQNDAWMFSIKDNGIGIEPEFYNKIFVMFQRLHNRNEYDGTGIGLAIAKKHVEFLGGKIWLDSIPDNGTTFYFTIAKNST